MTNKKQQTEVKSVEDESDCYFAIEQPPIDPNLSVVENIRNLLDKTKITKYNRDKDTGFFSEA